MGIASHAAQGPLSYFVRLVSYRLLGSLSPWESLLMRRRDQTIELLRAIGELLPAGIALPLGIASHAAQGPDH
ncbi:hypothetical protein ACOZB4_26500 [Paenibacillus sp. NPDC058898]|uniref:hypothetical protein n=1 Tax=Paenibacillus sp. NPDC058898 TaxID=3346669 RepID=UPI003BF55E4A